MTNGEVDKQTVERVMGWVEQDGKYEIAKGIWLSVGDWRPSSRWRDFGLLLGLVCERAGLHFLFRLFSDLYTDDAYGRLYGGDENELQMPEAACRAILELWHD